MLPRNQKADFALYSRQKLNASKMVMLHYVYVGFYKFFHFMLTAMSLHLCLLLQVVNTLVHSFFVVPGPSTNRVPVYAQVCYDLVYVPYMSVCTAGLKQWPSQITSLCLWRL